MKTIHLAGLGNAAMGMYKCLKNDYIVQGHDQSMYAETLAKREGIKLEHESERLWYTDLIIPTPDPLVKKYSDSDLSFLPDRKEIELCQDKAKCATVLKDLSPKVYWVRDTEGAGGKGAQMCSEYLPGRNVSCELVFNNGKFINYFQKERLSYSLKENEKPLDKKGTSIVSKCIKDDEVLELSLKAIERISKYCGTTPNGFYGIDFKQNEQGKWKITEINAGRLLTASYCYFYKTGYNLALAGIKSYLGEPYDIGEYPEGTVLIRQYDGEPQLFKESEIE